jgi:hypothetical protein
MKRWRLALPSKARSFLLTIKGQTMKKEPTLLDILGACIMGAILGAFIAFNF